MDAVVPASANFPVLPSIGFPYQSTFAIEGQQKFDASAQFAGAFQKPEGERSRCCRRVVSCAPCVKHACATIHLMLKPLRFAGQLIAAPMDHSVVPQQGSNGGLPYRLSTIERQELELARRRAEKAAEGKRANAAQARAKRRASRPRPEDRLGEQGEGGEGSNGEEDDLEAKLANTKDEKEAKRLRRSASRCMPGFTINLVGLTLCSLPAQCRLPTCTLSFSSLQAFLPDPSIPCRLLRNRVSAQQARERKKSYVSNLEQQAKAHEQSVSPHAQC